jgi:hypothetical protein
MIPSVINITAAKLTEPYMLCLEFDDGSVQTVDFLPFLSRSIHPAIRAYLEPHRFATFRIEYGELVWGDYDLFFPVFDLYCNRIDHHEALEVAA